MEESRLVIGICSNTGSLTVINQKKRRKKKKIQDRLMDLKSNYTDCWYKWIFVKNGKVQKVYLWTGYQDECECIGISRSEG